MGEKVGRWEGEKVSLDWEFRIGDGGGYRDWETAGETRLGKLEATTPEAQQWDGWGTALKPAFEPIVVARKPLIGTVAENVLQFGVGGLNIDASRIGTGEGVITYDRTSRTTEGNVYDLGTTTSRRESGQGRWPANLILDETTAEILDEQSGISKSLGHNRPHSTKWGYSVNGNNSNEYDYETGQTGYSDVGGASRFFYVAKASKRDRNEGLDELPEVRHSDRTLEDGVGGDNPRNRTNQPKQNFHPTVKPTQLMQYLIKLVTPPNGIVLDPFTGSGSTGKAAILEGFQFVGIEITADYLPIIKGRLEHAYQTYLYKAGELFE